MKLDPITEKKLNKLMGWFEGKVIVALSGGVDSSVVTAVARMAVGNNVLAVTAESLTLPPWELRATREVAEAMGVRHTIVKVDEISNPCIVENPPDRCYWCKKELSSALKGVAEREGIGLIVDGTNADDLKHHRPGALALLEEGVQSPLALMGLSKDEVRKIAKFLNLPTADKPSMACLASRFPYGQRITYEGLMRVARAERFITDLTGVKQVRVRDHDGIARIEVGRDERKLLYDEETMDSIAEELRGLGFKYVTMDLFGYRSGSMDEALKDKIIPERVTKTISKG